MLFSRCLLPALLTCVSMATEMCVDHGEEFERVFRRPGETGVMTCRAEEDLDATHPYTLEWYDPNTLQQHTHTPGRTILRGDTLWIFNLTQQDDGKYMCVVRSAGGGCSKKVYVLIVEPGPGAWPNRGCVNRDRSIQFLQSRNTGTLVCPIADYLPHVLSFTVTWYKGGCKEVPLGDAFVQRRDGMLQLRTAGLEHVDNYTCLFNFTMDPHTHTPSHTLTPIRGYMTETMETTVNVKVTYQPRILLPEGEIVKVHLGSSLHYVCRVLVPGVGDDHDVDVKWRESNSLISEDTQQRIHQILHRPEPGDDGVVLKSELILMTVHEDDLNTNFTCTTSSGYYNPQASIRLQRDSNLLLPLALVFVGVAVLFVVAVVTYRLFRIHIALACRDLMPYLYPSNEGDGKLYDAYVVYPRVIGQCGPQESFALGTLPRMLEGCYGYRLFILGRDCTPGEAVVDVVCASLSLSRRVLLLYGGSGFSMEDSDWWVLEQQLALQQSLLEDEQVGVVLVDLGGVADEELPLAVRMVKEEQGALNPAHKDICCMPIGGERERRKPIRREEEEEAGLGSISPSPRFWRELRYHMPIRGKARKHTHTHTHTRQRTHTQTHTHTDTHTIALTHTPSVQT